MTTRITLFLLLLAVALPLLASAEEVTAPQAPVILRVVPVAAVVAPTEPIQLSAALANALDDGVKVSMSSSSVVRWKVTDSAGAVLAEKTTSVPPVVVSLPKGSVGAVAFIVNKESVSPAPRWPDGKVLVTASATVTVAPAAEGAAPATCDLVGAAEIEIRAEGWAEEMYLHYVTEIDKILRPIFKQHEFEFPETRNLKPAEIKSDANGASARIAMNVERLVEVVKGQAPRLRTLPGHLTVYAVPPSAAVPESVKVSGLFEKGLVRVYLVVDTANQWWNAKAEELGTDLLKEIQAKGLAGAAATPRIESTDRTPKLPWAESTDSR